MSVVVVNPRNLVILMSKFTQLREPIVISNLEWPLNLIEIIFV